MVVRIYLGEGVALLGGVAFCRKFITLGVRFGVLPGAKESLLLVLRMFSLPSFLWNTMQNSHILLHHYVCLQAYHVSCYEEIVLNF